MTSLRAFAVCALAAGHIIVFGSASAFACACCADAGHRFERPGDQLEAFQIEELNQIKFAPDAKLRTTGAFPDDIKGFVPDDSGAYKIDLRRDQGTWRLDIKDSKGGAGTLAFKLPKTVDRLEFDFAAGDDERDGDVSLIKEWRLVAPVTGEGLFNPTLIKSARIRLILQGRGNACANDFKAWQLVVAGPRANFTFMGKLAP